jgi:ketosteroid isomerase-like protein
MWQRLLFVFAMSARMVLWCEPSDSSAQQKILQMEKEYNRAPVSGDASLVERFEASDIIMTAPDGNTANKTRDIEDIRSRKLRATSVDLEDLVVRIYGRTAVVTGRTIMKGAQYGGMDISGQYRFTDMWAQQSNGNWQIVAWQGTVIPQTK